MTPKIIVRCLITVITVNFSKNRYSSLQSAFVGITSLHLFWSCWIATCFIKKASLMLPRRFSLLDNLIPQILKNIAIGPASKSTSPSPVRIVYCKHLHVFKNIFIYTVFRNIFLKSVYQLAWRMKNFWNRYNRNWELAELKN